jgi:hypothetical protein
MKLNILPARSGYTWVKSGFLLFAYKPSAFIGFFASFMLLMLLVGAIPVFGQYLAMLAFPALSLGMMAVGNECIKLRTGTILPNTPTPMLMGWMTIRRSIKSLLQLGVGFALGFTLALLAGSAMDGGEFAKFYLQGKAISKEMIQDDAFQRAVFLTTGLYMLLAGVFWFAPALVNWKQMPLSKSLFFSAYAVFKNWRAFGVYILVWLVAFSVITAIVLTLGSLILGSALTGLVMMPLMVILSTVFMASTFPTFVDCFRHDEKK